MHVHHLLVVVLIAGVSHADLVLKPGTQVIFGDGTIMNSALAEGLSLPAGHGGQDNEVSGIGSFIGGGWFNAVDGSFTSIVGGSLNYSGSHWSTLGGGTHNHIWEGADYASVGGGNGNKVTSRGSTIAGGLVNIAGDFHPEQGATATIGGGLGNHASGDYSSIAGGRINSASEEYASVGGGYRNVAEGFGATVTGGSHNRAEGNFSSVGGGSNNTAANTFAVVGGGFANIASGYFATVGGGGGSFSLSDEPNIASGDWSTVPGGFENIAGGNYSFAAGRGARVAEEHHGTILFADSTGVDFHSAAPNEFAVRARGGFRFVTSTDSKGAANGGPMLAPGDDSWATMSRRDAKENFADVNSAEILEKVSAMDIQRWNYKHMPDNVQHIGPTAEEFHEAFGLNGEFSGRITTQDLDGIALSAIQGLNERLMKYESLIGKQQVTIDALQQELAALRALVIDNEVQD